MFFDEEFDRYADDGAEDETIAEEALEELRDSTYGYLDYEYPDGEDLSDFADPGGRSALRAATQRNPRNLPCPTCGEPNRLTHRDVELHYQCNKCADQDERGF